MGLVWMNGDCLGQSVNSRQHGNRLDMPTWIAALFAWGPLKGTVRIPCIFSQGTDQATDHETCKQTYERSRKPSTEPLPEISIEIKPTFTDFSDELVITDPENSSRLKTSLWRTVRFPEDGRVFDIPAGLEPFLLCKPSHVKRNSQRKIWVRLTWWFPCTTARQCIWSFSSTNLTSQRLKGRLQFVRI
jgi:hypothetical protein